MRIVVLVAATVAAVFGSAAAFDGEKPLYEAARKESKFTWYTAHFDTETAREQFRDTFGI